MFLALAVSLLLTDPADPRLFSTPSSDGVLVHGQADGAAHSNAGVVIMVAGTGPFDRDVNFGPPGETAVPVFADLAERLVARGVAVVRYDKRGVRYRQTAADRIDEAEIVTATTGAMRDDLSAVYDWTRSADGLNARCIAFFGHSEGMVHIGRLAASGAPAPVVTVGVGSILTDPVSNFHWNLAERDAWSLRLMDADGDGVTTNDEVRANLATTPAAVNGVIDPYLAPDGSWSAEDIAQIEAAWVMAYPAFRARILAAADDAPWPTAETPLGSMQWWKSWLLDTTPVAANLATWESPVIAHIGDRDSQTHAPLQIQAGQAALGHRLTVRLHPGVGHTLGDSPTYGPMRPDLADQVADELASALAACTAAN